MKLAHPYYFHPIDFECDFPMTLVVENSRLFRKIILEIIGQCEGREGNFILSENNEILDFSKVCLLISDVCRLDFLNRDIKGKIQKILDEEISGSDDSNKLIVSIEQFAAELTDHFKYPLKYRMNLQAIDLIKLIGFEIDESEAEPLEKLVDYMEIYTNLLSRKLIITVNLKDYISESEQQYFLKDVSNRQIGLLMLERHTHLFDDPVHRVIIDQDLCEISMNKTEM